VTDMLLTVDLDGLSEREHIHTIVRPVGPWRFLTPLDIIQPGDLFRVIVTDDSAATVYDANWSAVPPDHGIIGEPFHTCKDLDIIRPIDDTAYTVPVFKFEY
jgi:hypothetical protein